MSYKLKHIQSGAIQEVLTEDARDQFLLQGYIEVKSDEEKKIEPPAGDGKPEPPPAGDGKAGKSGGDNSGGATGSK